MRQRIFLQRIESGPESGVRSEFLQGLVRRNQLHPRDVRPLAGVALELLGFPQRHVGLQVDRQIDGVRKTAGGRLRIQTNSRSAVGKASASPITSKVRRGRERIARQAPE